MGELVIHIDQSSGAVLKVEQQLDGSQKELISRVLGGGKPQEGEEETFKYINDLNEKGNITEKKLEKDVVTVVTLEPMGNLYWDEPGKVKELKDHRDDFDRIVNLPVELWEKIGNTVCTIYIGGVPHRCVH